MELFLPAQTVLDLRTATTLITPGSSTQSDGLGALHGDSLTASVEIHPHHQIRPQLIGWGNTVSALALAILKRSIP